MIYVRTKNEKNSTTNVSNSSSKLSQSVVALISRFSCDGSRALRERDDVQSRVRTISVLAVLLQGPFDTGNAILGSQNLVDLMIQMAGSGDPLQEVTIVFSMTLKCCSLHLAYCCRSDRSIVIEERQGGWYHFTRSRNSQESLSIRQRRYQSVSSRGMCDRSAGSIFVWRTFFSPIGSVENCLQQRHRLQCRSGHGRFMSNIGTSLLQVSVTLFSIGSTYFLCADF